MLAFFDYLRNITYYLMFATVVGMIAPSGKYRKFVSLVMGFILLAVMLAPLARFGGGDIPITEWFSEILTAQGEADPGRAYTQWRNTYLREAFETQLRTQLINLLTQNGFTVYSSDFSYTEDFSRITSVRVTVSRQAEENRRVPFIRIEPVQINEDNTTCPIATDAKNLISEFYTLPVPHIHVTVQRS